MGLFIIAVMPSREGIRIAAAAAGNLSQWDDIDVRVHLCHGETIICPYEYANNQKMNNLEVRNCPKVIRNLSVHTAYPY